jgi:hypothetical protein
MSKDAARLAAKASPSSNPSKVARAAVNTAAQRTAPQLLGGSAAAGRGTSGSAGAQGKSGRWVRRGNRIILQGV